jgi:hypothetical protein
MIRSRRHDSPFNQFAAATVVLASLALAGCGGGSGDGGSSGGSNDPGGSQGGGGGTLQPAGDVNLQFPDPPSRGETVTSVTVTNTGASPRSDFRITFGQVFSPGAIGAGDTLTAKTESGTAVPLQVDRKATHRDDSLRHAVLSARIPGSLGAGEDVRIDLVKSGATSTSGTSPSKSVLLSGSFEAEARVTIGGTPYSASASDLLQNANANVWLDGDMVREWLVSGPLETAGGDAHPHLTARFHIRAYSQNDVRVAVIVENNKTFQPNPDTLTYDLEVTVTGDKFFQEPVEHYHHARWRRVFWTDGSNADHWPQGLREGIHVGHDVEYLQDTGAVPTYMDGLSVPESALDSMLSEFQTRSGTNGPNLMEIGSLNADMPATGFQPAIGLLPRSSARYLVTPDERAKRVIVGNAEQAGSWSIHFRDHTTTPELPVSIDQHPGITVAGWTCSSCSAPEEAPAGAARAGTFDVAHQPAPNVLPYILTGDYYLLEELQFWATYDLLDTDPQEGGRGFSAGVIHKNQQRGQAWALRTIAYAEYLTPDSHPMKSYWTDKLEHNRDWYTATYAQGDKGGLEHASTIPELDETWANDLGWIGRGNVSRDANLMTPWMDDFMTAVVGHITTGLRYTDWTDFFQFKARYPVARLVDPETDSDGWCYKNAMANKVVISPNATPPGSSDDTVADGLFTTMLASYQATDAYFAIDDWSQSPVADCQPGTEWNSNPASPTSQFANLTPAVALAADSGVPGAVDAYRRFCQRPTDERPNSREWSIDPEWAIVPRSTACR